MSVEYTTAFASIDNYEKGGIQLLNDNVKNYVFSNVYDVASKSPPFERVVVAKNLSYVIEAMRAEGTSTWFACAHDEFAVAMDYDVEIHFVSLDDISSISDEKEGASALGEDIQGQKMGRIKLRRGHMALLPEKTAYRFSCSIAATVIIQTILGDVSVEKWSEICIK